MNKSGKQREIPPSSNNTYRQRIPIDADSTYRIGICGFRIRGSRQLVRYLDEAVRAAFDGWNGKKLLLLPGRLKRKPWEHRDSWPPVDEIADVASKRKLPILFQTTEPETIPFYTAVSHTGKKLPLKLYQQFANCKDVTPEKVERLVKECHSKGLRAVHLGGLTLGLLICGENNVLANKQSHGNSVYVRYGRAPDLFRGFRIVYNGAHDKMGEWGKLDQRFKFLSKNRWFFYATNNNDKKEKWGKSTLCVYYKGDRIATSAGLESGTAKQEVNGRIKKWEDVHLRGQKYPISFALVTSKNDRCIILTVDIPGKLLQ